LDNAKIIGYTGKQVAFDKFNSDIQSKSLYNFFSRLIED